MSATLAPQPRPHPMSTRIPRQFVHVRPGSGTATTFRPVPHDTLGITPHQAAANDRETLDKLVTAIRRYRRPVALHEWNAGLEPKWQAEALLRLLDDGRVACEVGDDGVRYWEDVPARGDLLARA